MYSKIRLVNTDMKADNKRLRDIVWDNLPELAERYFAIMLNKPEAGHIPSDKVKQIITAFEQVLSRLPLEKVDVQAQTAADIIGLIKEGRVTLTEAKELMSILSIKFEMEELSALAAKLEEVQNAV